MTPTPPRDNREAIRAVKLDHWSVTVERSGEPVVTIEANCLSGREISTEDEEAIRTAAHHLLAFIGDPASASPVIAVDRNAVLEEAAKVCERLSIGKDVSWWLNATKTGVAAVFCVECAKAIRALSAAPLASAPCKTCGGRGTVSDWQPLNLKAETGYKTLIDFHKKCPDCSLASAHGDEGLVERVARAIWNTENDAPWDEYSDSKREPYRVKARAAITAITGVK